MHLKGKRLTTLQTRSPSRPNCASSSIYLSNLGRRRGVNGNCNIFGGHGVASIPVNFHVLTVAKRTESPQKAKPMSDSLLLF